jgi:hypothetical protein
MRCRFDAERRCCALQSRARTHAVRAERVLSLTLQKSRGEPTSRRASVVRWRTVWWSIKRANAVETCRCKRRAGDDGLSLPSVETTLAAHVMRAFLVRPSSPYSALDIIVGNLPICTGVAEVFHG